MIGSFFVGIVEHNKTIIRQEYREKLVLYTEDNFNYLDLRNEIIYTTDLLARDHVIKESLIPTEPLEYKEDYLYLLTKYKRKMLSKKN